MSVVSAQNSLGQSGSTVERRFHRNREPPDLGVLAHTNAHTCKHNYAPESGATRSFGHV